MNSNTFEQNGDAAVLELPLEALYSKYADMIFRLAYVRTRSRSDSDDIVQEVFLRLLRCGKAFNSEEHRKAWFIRATINCTNSLLSRSSRSGISICELTDTPQQAEDGSDTRLSVHSAVLSLPLKQRTAIHLFYYQDYKISEIAQIMGARENTVKSYLNRARSTLKTLLKEAEF